MGLPYRARVSERWFLNLPGFHGGAYVIAYVEDTRERGLQHCGGCEDENCRELPVQLRAADDSRDRRLQRSDQSRVRRRLGGEAVPTRCTSSTLCWRPCASFARASWPSSSRTTSGSASSQNSGTESRIERAAASIPAVARGRTSPRGRGAIWQTHRSQKPDMGVRLPPPAPCLRSSADSEHRASTPGAEVRILSGALTRDTVAERRGARLQSAYGGSIPPGVSLQPQWKEQR